MKKKNILFFFTDQQHKETLSCYGNSLCRTPAVERLAQEGVLFERAYTPSAICTPARASLVTGLTPNHHKLVTNYERNVAYNEDLDDRLIPFSRYLKEAGYRIGSIGKWHVGKTKGPEDFGFEGLHYPGWGETVHHPDYVRYLDQRGLPHFQARDHIHGTFPNGQPGNIMGGILEQPVEATFTYYLAEKTIEKLQEYAKDNKENGTPFFLSMNMFGPHMPYFLPESYANMYNPDDVVLPESFKETFANKPAVQRNYSAHWCFDTYSEQELRKMIAMYWGFATLIDEQIGRVLEALKQLRLEDETIVMFSTDHGSFEGHHKMYDKGPAMYEDIYNIPLIVKYPGGRRGEKEVRFVSLLDLTATFVDEACGYVPDHFDGQSLLPLLRGEEVEDWRGEIHAEFHGHHFPYPQRMIRTDRYKLVVNPPDKDEFYDLQKDPYELTNEIDNPEYQDVIPEHYRNMVRHLKQQGDNFYHWMYTMYDVGQDFENNSAAPFMKK
jgi:arylsulfatase A-like enzyme